jgi:hypothetical protein
MPYGNPPAPIVRPDRVEGVVGNSGNNVDRYFYLYDALTDLVFEADGYKLPQPGGGNEWMILLMCPCCQQTLRLESTKKSFEVTERGIETGEPISCSYWLNDVEGYTGKCPFREAEFEPPKKPEWGEVRTREGVVKVKIDAWIRRAK